MSDQETPPDQKKPRTSQGLTKSQAKLRDEVVSEFAHNLRKWREKKYPDTAKDMADALGIDDDRYRHWERGSATPPYEMLYRICNILGCTPNDLLPYKKSRQNGAESLPPRKRLAS